MVSRRRGYTNCGFTTGFEVFEEGFERGEGCTGDSFDVMEEGDVLFIFDSSHSRQRLKFESRSLFPRIVHIISHQQNNLLSTRIRSLEVTSSNSLSEVELRRP